jgi:hypothetical protein
VLDVLASNVDGFLLTDTCVSSSQINWPIWNSEPMFTLKNLCNKNYSIQKLTNSHWEAMC